MNTNALKKFAQETRRKLMQQVAAKLEFVLTADTPELRENAIQVRKLKEELKKTTREQLVDKVAYTWFNRFMALRFMDVNDYQPLGIRVISPLPNQISPEVLNQAKQGNIPSELKVDNKKVMDILDGRVNSSNPQNEVFKILLIGACNQLNSLFPFLFERINDYTELLLPDDLTSEFSVISDIVKAMSEDECKEVEIIGWLYQFYISEKKDEVFASKGKVKKEDIPAATQLFTPRWIVEYMVQNTLGKLWLQNKPNSKLRDHMPYFIDSASVESDDYLKVVSPEEIKLLDQAAGSGHILVYAFDLLTKIYEEEGYSQTEIASLIITRNLYGFEIDERAAQLAGISILMKAREYQRKLFKIEDVPKPNILCYKDLALSNEEINACLTQAGIEASNEILHDFGNLQQATNLGSLILPHASLSEIESTLQILRKTSVGADAFYQYQIEELKQALSQLLLLAKKYHCVVDNPPYMGGGKMNENLASWVKINYPLSKSDLMVCFMERAAVQLHQHGIFGMINLPSWMFLSSFEKYRKALIKSLQIDTLLHLGRGIFGADFGSVAFTVKNSLPIEKGVYRRLFDKHVEVRTPQKIEKLFLTKEEGAYESYQNTFRGIPGAPIAYWLSNEMLTTFEKLPEIKSFAKSGGRNKTHNDTRYVKFWWEVDYNKIGENWRLYENGGVARLWFGSLINVVNWGSEAIDYYKEKGGMTKPDCRNRVGIVWNMITAGRVTFRFKYKNSEYSSGAPTIFFETNDTSEIYYVLGFLNSKVAAKQIEIINPTLNTGNGVVLSLPFEISSKNQDVIEMVEENIKLAKEDWNNSEVSYWYRRHPLWNEHDKQLTFEENVDLYIQFSQNKINKTTRHERAINQHFIERYNLGEELSNDVTHFIAGIRQEEFSENNGTWNPELKAIIKKVISYFVGCTFGRYSLDKTGLIFKNQNEPFEAYFDMIDKKNGEGKFTPDDDNIVPILDDEWFEDDIVGRFYAFLKASFDEPNFRNNLTFIEEQIGDIRKYFVKDFYNDHIKRYKKRPIYWMFSSPKGHFNVLVYIHRYTSDTINNILNNYLREFIEKLKSRKEHFAQIQISGNAAEQTKAIKEIDKLDIVILDCQEYEREILFNLATERIEIDLDDGVLVNYNKFGNAVKEVKGLNDKKAKEKVRKFDWIDATQIR